MGVHVSTEANRINSKNVRKAANTNKNLRHHVKRTRINPPFPEDTERAMFGMGPFWASEQKFWSKTGVYTTAVGYSGGETAHPTYAEVCTGQTLHTEVVRVIFYPSHISYRELLKVFWENHDPTRRTSTDQYRSGIYYYDDEQAQEALDSKELYKKALARAGFGRIKTEVVPAKKFYCAEDYHQQYLAKSSRKLPRYRGVRGLGVRCPIYVSRENSPEEKSPEKKSERKSSEERGVTRMSVRRVDVRSRSNTPQFVNSIDRSNSTLLHKHPHIRSIFRNFPEVFD